LKKVNPTFWRSAYSPIPTGKNKKKYIRNSAFKVLLAEVGVENCWEFKYSTESTSCQLPSVAYCRTLAHKIMMKKGSISAGGRGFFFFFFLKNIFLKVLIY